MTQCLAELPLQTAWRVDLFRDAHHHHYHHHQRHISDICLWIKSSRRTRGWAPGLLCLRARVGGRGGDGDDGGAMRHRFAGRGTFRGVHMRSGFRGGWIDVVWWKGNLLYVLDTAWEDAIGRVRVCHSSPSLPSQISWVAPFRRCRTLPCYKGQHSSFSRREQTLWDIHTINAPDTAHRECNLRCESKINLEYGGVVTFNSRLEDT